MTSKTHRLLALAAAAAALALLTSRDTPAQVGTIGAPQVVLASVAAPYTIGDTFYADSTTTVALLAKNVTATRYLSNTGAGNVPAWAQVNVANGVTGVLPTANGGTGLAYFTAAGPTQARVYTFPDAAATVLTTAAQVTNAQLYGGNTPASSTGFGTGVAGVVQVGSVDFGGRVTIGTGGDTTGAVTFGGTYTVAPHCVANTESATTAVRASASTTILTLTATFTAGQTITWVCR